MKVQFTRNGRNTGDAVTRRPEGSNDVHFKFTRGSKSPKIRYTKDSHDLDGGEHAAPEGAFDVGVEFSFDGKGNLKMGDSHWTDGEGKPLGGIDGYIPPPEGANDWHLDVSDGKITEAFWTRNGHLYTPREVLDVPEDVNDVHVSAAPSGRPAESWVGE